MKRHSLVIAFSCILGVCCLSGCSPEAEVVQQIQISPEEAKKQALDKVLESKEIELYKIVTIGDSQDELLMTSSALTPERFGYLSDAKFYEYDSANQEYKYLSELDKPLWYTDMDKPVEGIPSEMVVHSILQGEDNNIYYTAGYGNIQVDRLIKTDAGYKWDVVVENQSLSLSNTDLEAKTRLKYGMKTIPMFLNVSQADKVPETLIKLNEDDGRFIAKGKLLYLNGAELADAIGYQVSSQANPKDMHLILSFNDDTEVPVFIIDDHNSPMGYPKGHNEKQKVKYLELLLPNGLQFDASALNSDHEFFDGTDVVVSIDPSFGTFMAGSTSSSNKLPVFYFYKFL